MGLEIAKVFFWLRGGLSLQKNYLKKGQLCVVVNFVNVSFPFHAKEACATRLSSI